MEVRIIAMIAGEASAFETAELQRTIASDAALQHFYQEMLSLSQHAASAALPDDDPAWKLSPSLREPLINTFRGDESSTAAAPATPASHRANHKVSHIPWRNIAGIAACLMLTLVITKVLFPDVNAPNRMVNQSEGIVSFSAPDAPGTIDPKSNVEGMAPRKPSAPASSAAKVIAANVPQPTPTPDITIDFGEGWGGRSNGLGTTRSTDDGIPTAKEQLAGGIAFTDEGSKLAEDSARFDGRLAGNDRDRQSLIEGKRKIPSAGAGGPWIYDGKEHDIAKNMEAAKLVPSPIVDLEKKSDQLNEIAELQKQSPTIAEVTASEQSHSTFSLNVSDVSFKLAQAAMLERGEWPSQESIRTEEFINAFDYGDPKPSMSEKVSCAIDQASHPFLQQRNLLRISLNTAAQGRNTPLDLTVLLDNSGSMDREDRESTMRKAIQVLADQLGPEDQISLISFARSPRLMADRINGKQAQQLVGIVANTPSEGGTNLENAVLTAHNHALKVKRPNAQSRIVVITDGAANLGNADPESLSKMVERMRGDGIAFDACGIGTDGLDDGILEALTRKGDGRYYLIDRPEDADTGFTKQLAGSLSPAAKNVKVQVVFNPDRVGSYRLLGFEKHRLNQEDFRNDKVDAAEMAAAESGSAVYQIESKPDGTGPNGTVFVRFQDAESGEMIERSWTIPYAPQPPHLNEAMPSMQLAATAGLLGDKLRGSDAGSIDFTQLRQTLGNLKAKYTNNERVQQLIQMCEKNQ